MASIEAGFGQELRAERELRGITLEQLCHNTKVSQKHLLALEAGDYRALPGGVFRRGIVRAFVGAIGLDEQVWLDRFDRCYAQYAASHGMKEAPDAGWATFAENVKKNRQSARRRTTGRWLGVFALFLLVMATAWLVWHFTLQPRVIR